MTEVNGVSFLFPLVFQGRGDIGVGRENKKTRKSEKEKLLGEGGISVSNQKFPANWMSDFINDEIYKGP